MSIRKGRCTHGKQSLSALTRNSKLSCHHQRECFMKITLSTVWKSEFEFKICWFDWQTYSSCTLRSRWLRARESGNLSVLWLLVARDYLYSKEKRNLGKYYETFRQGKRFTAKELRMVGVCKCEVGQYVLKKSELFTMNLLTLHSLSLLLTTHMCLYQDGVNTEKAAQSTLLKRYY